MVFIKSIAVLILLLLAANPCFSSSEELITKEQHNQTLFNFNILNMDRDASVFLHSLKVLRQEIAGTEVANFMEYQLDEIVCAADKFMEEMNPHQKKLTLNFLKDIKEYRAKYPRSKNIRVDPTKFSNHFEPFNESYAERADRILATLN